MKKNILIVIFHILIFSACARAEYDYDVVVYGGTPGGITAAIQASKMGGKVALVEPTRHIGGILTNGLGTTDIDSQKDFQNSVAVGGLALEFYQDIANYYDRRDDFDLMINQRIKDHELWPHEPHVAELIYMTWLGKNNVDVFFGSRLKESGGVTKDADHRICMISTEDGKNFKASVYIDASYEGDLLAFSGVSTTIGRESNKRYREIFNGMRRNTTHAQFKVPVDPYLIEGDPTSGLIYTIQNGAIDIPGSVDNHIMAYCYRVCLTTDSLNKIPFSKPKNYDRDDYKIYLRYLQAGGKLYTPWYNIPNGKSDLGAWHDLSHNLYGMNDKYPGGTYEERDSLLRDSRIFTEGLFYFLANDEEVGRLDPNLQKNWAQAGLTKDEFVDNFGWPRQIYVRDGRRMISDYVITEHQFVGTDLEEVKDPVGVAFWPPDLHNARRIVVDGKAYNEGAIFDPRGNWIPLQISYRSLVPKIEECANLLTPTCPSSSHVAYGAIRLEWTFMVLGQAVGAAAMIAVNQSKSVQNVSYSRLKDILLSTGQILKINKPERWKTYRDASYISQITTP